MKFAKIRRSFDRLSNISRLLRKSWRGRSIRDKRLAFLLGAVVCSDPRRLSLHRLIRWCIARDTAGNRGALGLFLNGRAVTISFRPDCEADFHIAGRLVLDAYDVPGFVPKTIIDGGANIGTFSLHAGSLFPHAHLICYEPHPQNAAVLRTNLARNHIAAEVHQMGLWSDSGTAYFKEDSERTGRLDRSDGGFLVAVTCPQIPEDTWLKLDVEGAEHEILPALFRIGKLPRHISLEIHNFRTRGQSLMALLSQHGYTIRGQLVPGSDCQRITANLQQAQGQLSDKPNMLRS